MEGETQEMNCETCEARKTDLQTGDEYCKELGALIAPGAVKCPKQQEKKINYNINSRFPIIFFRGKKSLGRLAFRIGLLGKDNFSLTIGRFTLRFLIFLFAEVILSVFTLCVPLIISISMSAFTKKKQNFHDFMLDIKEVDTYGTKIYLDKYDILKEENKHEPIDFISR